MSLPAANPDLWRRWGARVLVAQGGLVAVWWASLALSHRVRGWFDLDRHHPHVLGAFLLGDLVVLCVGSIIAGIALAAQRWWADRLVAFVAGATAYSTLYLVAWVVLGGHGWIGLVPMVAATIMTTAITCRPNQTRR